MTLLHETSVDTGVRIRFQFLDDGELSLRRLQRHLNGLFDLLTLATYLNYRRDEFTNASFERFMVPRPEAGAEQPSSAGYRSIAGHEELGR